ncbi:MAG: hypothetical protein WBP72_06450 [Rhodocyclaceae bacterium]
MSLPVPRSRARPRPRRGAVIEGPSENLVNFTHLIYALHSLSVLIGVASSATVLGAFVFGVPSLIAVILNYARRSDANGTYLDSHFEWQIRTFWWAVLWGLLSLIVTFALIVSIIGLLVYWLPMAVVGLWVGYRVLRGWIALSAGRPMPIA